MLGKMGLWRHVVAAGMVGGTSLLAATGVIGRGNLPERFESKVVTVEPIGDDGVRIREVVDQDFGTNDRHGYERTIPTDFGYPQDIEASSPDADASIDVTTIFGEARIRLGDPGTTYSGQHRYVLAYTLPDARISSGQLALDIIGTDEELETGRFGVVVAGLELDEPTCNVGTEGASGGCTLVRDADVYRVVISPLQPGQGITIGGTISRRTSIKFAADPVVPERRSDDRMALALVTIPIGLVGAGAVYAAARRAGRNEVFAGGAADAAYGSLPLPNGDAPPPVDVQLVPDSKMDELATIEFVPPKGIEPWQGAVLLNERIDRSTVAAFMSGLVAKEALALAQNDGALVISRGSKFDSLGEADRQLAAQLLDYGDELALGTYNPNFGQAWGRISTLQRAAVAKAGWWKRQPPGNLGGGVGASTWLIGAIIAFVLFGAGSLVTALAGTFRGKAPALLFALVVPAVGAYFVYRRLLPARTATGSALTLRAESFRRFLAASEGQHVDWAWKHGLLREYSAWAVALGAADAWGRALANSNVPAPEKAMASPMLVYSMGPSFDSTRSAPAPTGGGSGGGGFSGGSVGGGGGGGSSGSW